MALDNEKCGQTDEILVELAKQGDEKAFWGLVRRHERYVFNVAYRILGNREDAQDMAQEVFIQCHRRIQTFRGDAAFSTWLYRIALCRSLNALRSRKRHTYGLGMFIDKMTDWFKSSAGSAHEHILGRETERQLEEALSRLDERYRVPLVLCIYENMGYADIAEVLGRPLGTVARQINEGRRQLREHLGVLTLV